MRSRFRFWVESNQRQGGAVIETSSVDALTREELVLQSLRPFEETGKSWRTKPVPARLLDEAALAKKLTPPSGPARDLVVCVSHDDYINVAGGVQVCIQREQNHVQKNGFWYLQIYPVQPAPPPWSHRRRRRHIGFS